MLWEGGGCPGLESARGFGYLRMEVLLVDDYDVRIVDEIGCVGKISLVIRSRRPDEEVCTNEAHNN